MHVVYLQPFWVLNATTACVVFNLPLLRAGLAPVTFAETPVRDFMDGMLGIWELNRIELLRDVVIRAVADREICGPASVQ